MASDASRASPASNSPLAPQRAVSSIKDAWLKLANQCTKNHGGNDCWKVTSDISPALRDALKGDYRGYVNRCNDHKGDESACNIVATMNTTLFIAGCRQPHHLDTDDWTCSLAEAPKCWGTDGHLHDCTQEQRDEQDAERQAKVREVYNKFKSGECHLPQGTSPEGAASFIVNFAPMFSKTFAESDCE
jgi:hypothetical protein